MSLGLDQLNRISTTRYGMGLDVEGAQQPSAPASVPAEAPSMPGEGIPPNIPPRAAHAELDRLMLSVARESYSEVTSREIESHVAARELELAKGAKKKLCSLADRAERAMKEIRNLSVRDIVGNTKAVEAKFNAAADLQFQLANKLREIADTYRGSDSKLAGYRQLLDDMSLTCDSRGSEILTLYMEVQTFHEQKALPDGSGLSQAKAGELLKGMAGSMHGNDQVGRFEQEVAAIEKSLAAFATSQTVDETRLQALQRQATALNERLAGPEVRGTMDKNLHAALSARLASVQKDVNARARFAVEQSIRHLFGQTFRPTADFSRLVAAVRAAPEKLKALGLFVDPLVRLSEGKVDRQEDLETIAWFLSDRNLDNIAKILSQSGKDLAKIVQPEKEGDKKEGKKADAEQIRAVLLKSIGLDKRGFEQAVKVCAEMRKRGETLVSSGAKPLVGEDVIHAFARDDKLSMVLEARVNGVNERSLDPRLSDRNVIAAQKLGNGNVNTVYKLTYRMDDGTTKDFVFKPDLSGRVGLHHLTVGEFGSYVRTQQSVKLNQATCDVAELLGIGSLTGKNYATVHDGQYGLLMEVAPGVEAAEVNEDHLPGVTKTLRDQKVVGSLARQLNDLQWLDVITGQGDRHAHNYFVDFGNDGRSPKVTAIDNDLSFPPYLVGIGKFKVNHSAGRLAWFRAKLEETCRASSGKGWEARFNALMNGIEQSGFVVDTDKAEPEVIAAVYKGFGFHTLMPPRQMSRSMYDKIVNLSDEQLNAFAEKLAANVDDRESVAATVQRLRDLKALAFQYAQDGRVIEDEAWESGKDAVIREFQEHPTVSTTKRNCRNDLVKSQVAHCMSSYLQRNHDGVLKTDFKVHLDPEALKKMLPPGMTLDQMLEMGVL